MKGILSGNGQNGDTLQNFKKFTCTKALGVTTEELKKIHAQNQIQNISEYSTI